MRHTFLVLMLLVIALTVWLGGCRFGIYKDGESMWTIPKVDAYTSKKTHKDRQDALRLLEIMRGKHYHHHRHSGHGGGCFIATVK